MQIIKIEGGKPLEGTVSISGAKNAITKLLVASLLSDQPCTFYNVPDIGDVEVTLELCRELGSEVSWDKAEKILKIVTPKLKSSYISQRYSGANRIPILMIGALLGRCSEDVIVPTTGGCHLGKRPVDYHIQALEKLGAQIDHRVMSKEGAYLARAYHGLKGAIVELNYPSVGATENTLLAAVRAKGKTLIKNAAIEPEIMDLILFLQKLGANITLDTDRTITIVGTQTFHPVEHKVIFDRNVAASYALAAVATDGRVFVEGAEHSQLITFLNYLRQVGGGFHVKNGGIEFFKERAFDGSLHIETDVHPGFMTDWQQPFTVLLTQAKGSSVVHETVYEERFGYIKMLKTMGADIELFTQCLGSKNCRFQDKNYQHSAVIKGPTPLQGQHTHIPDLRAGFAYIMAALTAQGTSYISGLEFVQRGYENLVENLQSLNADIELIPAPQEWKEAIEKSPHITLADLEALLPADK